MRRHATFIALSAISLILMPLLTARGRIGGDELQVFQQLNDFYSTGLSLWDYLLSRPDGWLTHRFFWFFQQYALVGAIKNICQSLGLFPSQLILQYFVSYSQSLLAWGGLIICAWYAVICMKMSYSRAYLLVVIFWFSGYGLCFLIGNYVENSMILLLAIRLFIFQESNRERESPWTLICLIVVDFLLIAVKPYSIIFTCITLPLACWSRSKIRFYSRYVMGLAALLTLWGLLIFIASPGNIYAAFPWSFSPSLIFERLFHAGFSFTFGLAWTFPAIWFLLAVSGSHFRVLRLKIAALVGLQLFFSTLPFWHGGIAGGRYIFPYLIFLLPEIAIGFRNILEKKPISHLLVVIGFVVSLPIIDYRNTNVSEYYNNTVFREVAGYNELLSVDTYPLYDWTFHPVIFAWRVLYAKVTAEPSMNVADSVPVPIATNAIYPMTGLSRIAYLIETRPPVGEEALRYLEAYGLGSIVFWNWIRLVVVVAVFLSVLTIALIEMRSRNIASPLRTPIPNS